MNQWHLGYIDQWPVEVFLSDDYSMDYALQEDLSYPSHILETCESIRAANVRSLNGCQSVLAGFGWSNA